MKKRYVRNRNTIQKRPFAAKDAKNVSRQTSQNRVRQILVPTDFSKPSLLALDHAVDRARDTGATIILLHVIPPLHVPERFKPLVSYTLRTEGRRGFRRQLWNLANSRREPGLSILPWLLHGNPAKMIVEAASNSGSDIIIMGSIGRSGLQRLLLGSVAERVVRDADVPVLVFREPPRRKKSLPRVVGLRQSHE